MSSQPPKKPRLFGIPALGWFRVAGFRVLAFPGFHERFEVSAVMRVRGSSEFQAKKTTHSRKD